MGNLKVQNMAILITGAIMSTPMWALFTMLDWVAVHLLVGRLNTMVHGTIGYGDMTASYEQQMLFLDL